MSAIEFRRDNKFDIQLSQGQRHAELTDFVAAGVDSFDPFACPGVPGRGIAGELFRPRGLFEQDVGDHHICPRASRVHGAVRREGVSAISNGRDSGLSRRRCLTRSLDSSACGIRVGEGYRDRDRTRRQTHHQRWQISRQNSLARNRQCRPLAIRSQLGPEAVAAASVLTLIQARQWRRGITTAPKMWSV